MGLGADFGIYSGRRGRRCALPGSGGLGRGCVPSIDLAALRALDEVRTITDCDAYKATVYPDSKTGIKPNSSKYGVLAL